MVHGMLRVRGLDGAGLMYFEAVRNNDSNDDGNKD